MQQIAHIHAKEKVIDLATGTSRYQELNSALRFDPMIEKQDEKKMRNNWFGMSNVDALLIALKQKGKKRPLSHFNWMVVNTWEIIHRLWTLSIPQYSY